MICLLVSPFAFGARTVKFEGDALKDIGDIEKIEFEDNIFASKIYFHKDGIKDVNAYRLDNFKITKEGYLLLGGQFIGQLNPNDSITDLKPEDKARIRAFLSGAGNLLDPQERQTELAVQELEEEPESFWAGFFASLFGNGAKKYGEQVVINVLGQKDLAEGRPDNSLGLSAKNAALTQAAALCETDGCLKAAYDAHAAGRAGAGR